MRFLISTFLIVGGLFAAVLFWWRPAPELLALEPVDWAEEYEAQHTPGSPYSGAIGMAREIIRTSQTHKPLTEFIAEQTGERLSRVEGGRWQAWADRHFSDGSERDAAPAYLGRGDPLGTGLSGEYGYVELRRDNGIDFFQYQRLSAEDLSGREIPAGLRFPYRKTALALFGATLIFFLVNHFRKSGDHRLGRSSAGRGCKVFIAIGAAGAALVVLPFLYGWINASPPFVFVGGFVVICGIIGLAMFGWQAVTVSNLLNGKGLLAHWTYTPQEWQAFTEWAFTESIGERLAVGLLEQGADAILKSLYARAGH